MQEDAQLAAGKKRGKEKERQKRKEEEKQPLSGRAGRAGEGARVAEALAFFLPSETPSAEAARERRLSIFTSNEFELKTLLHPLLPPPDPQAAVPVRPLPRPRPPPLCLDHAATLCSTNHANHCAA